MVKYKCSDRSYIYTVACYYSNHDEKLYVWYQIGYFYFSDRSKQFPHNSDFNVLRRGYSEGAELKAVKYEGKHVFLTWKFILWKICFERFYDCDNRCFLSFIQKEINDGVHTTPDLDPKLESNATNEVDSILKTLCLEPYIPNFKEQVCIYYKSQVRF